MTLKPQTPHPSPPAAAAASFIPRRASRPRRFCLLSKKNKDVAHPSQSRFPKPPPRHLLRILSFPIPPHTPPPPNVMYYPTRVVFIFFFPHKKSKVVFHVPPVFKVGVEGPVILPNLPVHRVVHSLTSNAVFARDDLRGAAARVHATCSACGGVYIVPSKVCTYTAQDDFRVEREAG